MTHNTTHNEYSATEQQQLLRLARASIAHTLQHGTDLQVQLEEFPAHLRAKRACFVTLKIGAQLRGCIGSMQATQPLAQEVAARALDAAFNDPRFEPLQPHELDQLTIHISMLNPMEPLTFTNRDDLLRQLRPGIDGLLVEDGSKHATFLPAVWQALPKKEAFLTQLMLKAGLPAGHWSSTLRIHRYTCSSFGEYSTP
jgi:AmmeMemoRadiSam system protein A